MSNLHKQSYYIAKNNSKMENWNIITCVVRSWFVQDYTKRKSQFSMEIILRDKE